VADLFPSLGFETVSTLEDRSIYEVDVDGQTPAPRSRAITRDLSDFSLARD
jgi:hypothetical protein